MTPTSESSGRLIAAADLPVRFKDMAEEIGELHDLAALESFDPAAFRSDEGVPEHVCNFVLTLALVFNDLRDLLFVHNLLISKEPSGEFRISRRWGAYIGAWYHSQRLLVALFHEILNLLHDNKKALDHPFFKAVLKQVPREGREYWHALVQASEGKQADNPVGKFAVLIRNKLVFHYDAKEIFSGYSRFFSSQNPGAASAFLSRGASMSQTRYFFADAAAQGYFTKGVQDRKTEDLLMKLVSYMPGLGLSLMSIIHHFIQKRGFTYRTAKEETSQRLAPDETTHG
jgi:hypothetical protein